MTGRRRIDQQLCTGDGLCEQSCPELFVLGDDGYAYVRDPAGDYAEQAVVPVHLADSAAEAAEECPGECIFLQPA